MVSSQDICPNVLSEFSKLDNSIQSYVKDYIKNYKDSYSNNVLVTHNFRYIQFISKSQKSAQSDVDAANSILVYGRPGIQCIVNAFLP